MKLVRKTLSQMESCKAKKSIVFLNLPNLLQSLFKNIISYDQLPYIAFLIHPSEINFGFGGSGQLLFSLIIYIVRRPQNLKKNLPISFVAFSEIWILLFEIPQLIYYYRELTQFSVHVVKTEFEFGLMWTKWVAER